MMNALPPGIKNKPAAARLALPYWIAEFALISRPVLAFAATLLIGTAAVLLSREQLDERRADLRHAQQLRSAAFDRFSQVDQEKREMRDYEMPFIALRDQGLIGAERRLEWIDAIRQIRAQRNLLAINYEFDAQQPLRLDTALALGDYQLLASRMRLHLDLLHEGDLFNFLEDLKQKHYYSVQDCSLKRNTLTQGALLAPALSADCTLHWLTLGRAKAEAEAATVPATATLKGALP